MLKLKRLRKTMIVLLPIVMLTIPNICSGESKVVTFTNNTGQAVNDIAIYTACNSDGCKFEVNPNPPVPFKGSKNSKWGDTPYKGEWTNYVRFFGGVVDKNGSVGPVTITTQQESGTSAHIRWHWTVNRVQFGEIYSLATMKPVCTVAGTSIHNGSDSVSCTYSDSNGKPVGTTTSNIATTTVTQGHGVAFIYVDKNKSGSPGSVTHNIEFVNPGNGEDTFIVEIKNIDGATWTTLIHPRSTFTVGANDFGTFSIVVKVGETGSYSVNVLTIKSSGTEDTWGAPNRATITLTTVSGKPKIAITKTASIESGLPGQKITYILLVTNTGDAEATNYIDDSASDDGTYDPKTGVIEWTIDSIQPGESKILKFEVEIQ